MIRWASPASHKPRSPDPRDTGWHTNGLVVAPTIAKWVPAHRTGETLLPKLISGEICVKDAERFVSEVA